MRTLLFYRRFDQLATDLKYKPDNVNFTLKWQPWVSHWFVNPLFEGMNPDQSCVGITVSNWAKVKGFIPDCYKPVAIIFLNPDGSYCDSFCDTFLPDSFFPKDIDRFIYSDID